ncbi:MAG: HAD family phosphatase [Robiginitalea sp.]
MIKNLIFDFGGVLIDLDMEAVPRGLQNLGIASAGPDLVRLSQEYETGRIPTDYFLQEVRRNLPGSREEEIRRIWNATVTQFPKERLDFLEALKASRKYRMFLLSNTNPLHVEQARQNMGDRDFTRFRKCFRKFYLSHEIGMRKPSPEIFKFVLEENDLVPGETLFIDDTLEHTESASGLGICTWHLQVGRENILELHQKLS